MPPTPEIVRIDFFQTPAGWVLNHYRRCGRSLFLPVRRETKPPEFDMEAALIWCAQERWEVRRWPTGARAWKHGIEPVRTAEMAERMERDGLLKIDPTWREIENFDINSINYRYDL